MESKLCTCTFHPESTMHCEVHNPTADPVNKPSHYALMGDIEAIDVIRRTLTPEQFKGYCLGNFLKYRLRAGEKDALQQDIDKSEVYRNWFNNEEM